MAKAERIDLRVQQELKERFSAAAEAVGMSLTGFVIAAAQEQAARVLRTQRSVILSDRDRDRFLAALDRSARPAPESVRRAKERHATRVVDG
jgi:uncharacterized protein (DUF1778 family)